MGINMASRFDYQGKVTTNVNKKKKRKLDRPKETPVGPPKRLVQEQPRTRTYLPNPGQAPVAKKAPSGVSNVPQAKPKRMKPSVGNGGLRLPKVSVSISNETAVGRGLNRVFTGSPNRTVEERKKRWEGIQSRAGNR